MKTLLILRHAKSSYRGPNSLDHNRPLDELAKYDARNVGYFLRNKDMTPDCIISSVAVRAKSTAEHVAEVCKYKLEVVLEQSLYQAKTIDYLNIIEGISDKHTRVLLVGHNPTVEEVIEMLTDSLDTIRMPPCALAHLNLQIEKWSDLNKQEKINSRVQLVNIWKKEDLPTIENDHKSNI
jgi:phosphohistidine phosphatase